MIRRLQTLLEPCLLASAILLAQDSAAGFNGFDLSKALISPADIRSGGPPRDGIPSIDQPRMIPLRMIPKAYKKDRVLGIALGDQARAYPLRILNWHEVVNDRIGSTDVVVTFCPLCGSGMTFLSTVQGKKLTFGVSGLLYQSDVLLYDRETESLWSQLMEKAVSGPLAGSPLVYLDTRQTTLEAWGRLHPKTLVLSEDTGFSRDYDGSPYLDYLESRSLWFPVKHPLPKHFHPKEKILGLTHGAESLAVPLRELKKAPGPVQVSLGGRRLTISYDPASQSADVRESSGDTYPSITALFFAWYTFHPDTKIYASP